MLHIVFDADGEGGDGHDVDDAASDWSRSQVLQDVAMCCSVLQCVVDDAASDWSRWQVAQRVAVCCSMLQRGVDNCALD